MTLIEAYREVERAQEEVKGLRTRIERKNRQISGMQEALKRRVLGGETSGDRVRDFAIASLLDWNGEAPYRALDEALRGRTGQFILLQYWEHVCIRHVMFPTPGHENIYEWQRRFQCGVLAGEELVLTVKEPRPEWAIPVASHVECTHHTLAKRDGTFCAGLMHSFAVPLLADAPLPPDTDDYHALRFHVGDELVKAYLATHFGALAETLFRECAEKLGMLVLTAEDAGDPNQPELAIGKS